MFLFLISFLLVFASSYLLTSIIAPKKSILGLIYIFLIAFAQIILTFEVLSLFTAIKQFWVLAANVIFSAASIYIWNKKSRPLWSLSFKDFRNKVNNSLKLDKSLMWLYVGFLTLILVSVFLNLIMPITNADAQAYHVARSLFWVLQESLNHFETSDIRNLCLPINSEILYAWVILFLKTDVLLGFFAFVGYLLSMVSIYNILGLLGYCTRKKLWVIFILSSFPSVLVQISGTETDIIIAGLTTSCIFLFWYALKNNEKTPLFMSSLAYALALGTKTTSIIAIPGVGIFLLALCFYFKKYKPLGLFLGFGLLNFLIFSSYNYILNFIHFSSFTGPASFMVVSKNYFGIKGMISNFIKYIFMFVDFTGFRWSDFITPQMITLRNGILGFMHLRNIDDGIYTTNYVVNRLLLEPLMGAGILGFLVYIPCLIWALIKPIFKNKSKKIWFIFVFACALILNLLSISYLLTYMSFSIRFLMSFVVISSPVLVYSYLSSKNPLKYVIVTFALFYLICVSTHLWPRPFMKLARIIVHEHHSIIYARYMAKCKDFDITPAYTNGVCPLIKKIQNTISEKNKILVFADSADTIYLLKALEFKGYKIDFRLMEDAKNIDFDKYNLIIIKRYAQKSTYIKYYEKRKNEVRIVKNKIITDKNNLVPCLYMKNESLKKSSNQERLYPYQSICGMSKKFIINHNLEKVFIAGVIKPNVGEYNYYVAYRNKKLPLKFKKRPKRN